MNCICCNNITTETVYKDQFYSNNILHCPACGHLQLLKMPGSEVIQNFYCKAYSETRKRYVSPEYLNIMRKRASAQFDYIFSVLGNRFSSVCDIGCGYGMLVATFLNAGFSVIGYEYDPLAISYCHNSKLPVTMLQSDTDLSMMPSVDVVTLSHVLEHLTSYDETIAILKNKAHYLFIEIPLYDVALAGQFIDQEGHVNFFTAESLQHFMAGKGFELLDIKRCGPGLIEFCSQRWQMQLQRKIKQCISRDYFMNCYNSAKDNGMWLRAVYKV